MWQTVKDYPALKTATSTALDPFASGSIYARRKNKTKKQEPTQNILLGVHITEQNTPLLGLLVQASKPPCVCQGIKSGARRINAFCRDRRRHSQPPLSLPATRPTTCGIDLRNDDAAPRGGGGGGEEEGGGKKKEGKKEDTYTYTYAVMRNVLQ